MRPRPLSILLTALFIALPACQSKPAPTVHVAETTAPDRFAAGRALLDGFDPPDPGGDWLPGDRVLLGIGIDGAGPPREWYMRVMAGPRSFEYNGTQYTSPGDVEIRAGHGPTDPVMVVAFDYIMMHVELFDGRGQPISQTTALMPEVCLRYGLSENIEQERAGIDLRVPGEHEEALPDGKIKANERQVRHVAGLLALSKFPAFLKREKSMGTLIQDLADHPGLLSLVVNGGVSLGLSMRASDATVEEPAPGAIGPVYSVPLTFELNDKPAMLCTLRVAKAAPPLGPCNGILQIDGVNPSDPSKKVTVRLLAAKRGAVQPAQKKAEAGL